MDDQNTGLMRLGAVILGLLMIGGAILADMHQSYTCGGLVIGGSLIVAASVIASAISSSAK
jgi:hypothetical protein